MLVPRRSDLRSIMLRSGAAGAALALGLASEVMAQPQSEKPNMQTAADAAGKEDGGKNCLSLASDRPEISIHIE